MGLSLEASKVYERARPAFLDETEEYPAHTGQCLYLVTKREPKLQGRWLTRRIVKILAWLDGTFKPGSPYEIEGLMTTEERASAACEDKNWDYAPLRVNHLFPKKLVRWKGVCKPRAWFQFNREPEKEILFEQVERDERRRELLELREWREGKRETPEVALLRKQADCLTRLARFEREVDEQLEGLVRRVEALEKKGAARLENRPHRVGAASA